jgi:hypothetical protein
LKSGDKVATNVKLLERNRIHGWIVIIREGKGFIEENNPSGNIEPIVFTINSFPGDGTQIELGDEVEFSLRKVSNRLIAENILKVTSTINNFYVSFIQIEMKYSLFLFFIVNTSNNSSRSCCITCKNDS